MSTVPELMDASTSKGSIAGQKRQVATLAVLPHKACQIYNLAMQAVFRAREV